MRRAAKCPSGTSNVAFAMAWAGRGIGILVTQIAIALAANGSHDDGMLELLAPVAFGFYGAAWFAIAALARRPWMYVASAASFAICLALAALMHDLRQLLVFGMALFLTLTLPSIKLMHENRA